MEIISLTSTIIEREVQKILKADCLIIACNALIKLFSSLPYAAKFQKHFISVNISSNYSGFLLVGFQ